MLDVRMVDGNSEIASFEETRWIALVGTPGLTVFRSGCPRRWAAAGGCRLVTSRDGKPRASGSAGLSAGVDREPCATWCRWWIGTWLGAALRCRRSAAARGYEADDGVCCRLKPGR
ncbi:transposase [Ralstonia solanacearum UW551]|uniref:Transposase n=1 Tax=Ralstonia solanacearum (strain UW551) TaxID=342110 RepID=A0AB33V7X8_RALSU|nr:transposase [Ralstonia solanacearum UW551]